MVLAVVVILGLYLPFALYGGIGEMFRAISAERPGFLSLPNEGLSVPWFISTVLIIFGLLHVTARLRFGFLGTQGANLPPHRDLYAALRADNTLRVLRRFRSSTKRPQPRRLSGRPRALAGLVAVVRSLGGRPDPVAGLLAALVLGSVIVMVSAMVLSKNVYRAMRPGASEETVGRLARFLVPVFGTPGRARHPGVYANERPGPGAPRGPRCGLYRPAPPAPALQPHGRQPREQVGRRGRASGTSPS